MGWILDVIFIVILLGGLFFGVMQGFIKGVCKIAGTIFSLGFAFVFCVAFQDALEGMFGLTTALSNVIDPKIAYWIAVGISFLILFLLIKFGSMLLGSIGNKLVSVWAPVRVVNQALGGLLGCLEGAMIIFIMLMVCRWINADTINAYIESSAIVRAIYNWDWFIMATQWIPNHIISPRS